LNLTVPLISTSEDSTLRVAAGLDRTGAGAGWAAYDGAAGA
jgi:hypothetical protein